MILSISGTPGTGKTKVARILAKQMDANLIALKALKVPYEYDRKRRTKIVDVKALQEAVNRNIDKNRINIIEGHLSHMLKSDAVIVLRTNPITLEKRLKKRKWRASKIKENVMAEFLDEITIEAFGKHKNKNVFEIDTSKISEDKTADIISEITSGKKSVLNKFKAGRINWSEKYKRIVIR